mmetsp:Transcript_29750/g.65148  ORF Transcript_29750/g.65148 Transcript_29750/m.65148 type:complete len:102 (+) Transcript_29750:41-346(+)|eukprot:CAMPEP_0116916338 /NCGR_PEP_ID=MMETSP0467-20121206/18470_1 /TAXON_ID=283647 /ORGANISM="Mesodinium pulex, Strain SPMC105" /LENGTH=101 /DNA_ID=CAMNT_0004593185 /DNA_START=41 /DNA_END=346 /DNA_ORIENTATION=-
MPGIAAGANKGHIVEKVEKELRPSYRKGKLGARTAAVREIVREVVGLAPYEKRILDILKTGGATSEKRAYKMAKNRLGTHKRALKKREDIKDIYAAIRSNA